MAAETGLRLAGQLDLGSVEGGLVGAVFYLPLSVSDAVQFASSTTSITGSTASTEVAEPDSTTALLLGTLSVGSVSRDLVFGIGGGLSLGPVPSIIESAGVVSGPRVTAVA